MPISISSVDDYFDRALQHQRKFGWMQTVFSEFADVAADIFSDRDPLRLNLKVTLAPGHDGSFFTLVFCGRSVRFSFVPVPGGSDYTASLLVHVMPTHAEIEVPLLLSEVRITGDGVTNIESNGVPCSLRSRDGILVMLLHFIVQASSVGFCPK